MINNSDTYFELLEPILKDLERFSIFLTRNRNLAKDVLSESIIRGHSNFSGLKNSRALKSFMFTIITRTHSEYKYKSYRSISSPNEEFDELYSKELSPEERTDVAFMYAALDEMAEDERNIIIMAELTGLPHKEIAKVMNITIANVKIRLFRAKKKLKQLMIPEFAIAGKINESEEYRKEQKVVGVI